MADSAETKERCKGCDREIDICAFCQEPGCAAAICYGCQNRELRQTVPQPPHAHGG